MNPIGMPIDQIVPHAAMMCLLDRALEGDAESIVCEVEIRADNPFIDGTEVGAWVGVEYMAQAIAAWAGWRARLRSERPKVGFLLGTRRLHCTRPAFHLGETLRVRAHHEFQADNGIGQFQCSIHIAGEEVAAAALTVFEPLDAAQFLQGGSHA